MAAERIAKAYKLHFATRAAKILTKQLGAAKRDAALMRNHEIIPLERSHKEAMKLTRFLLTEMHTFVRNSATSSKGHETPTRTGHSSWEASALGNEPRLNRDEDNITPAIPSSYALDDEHGFLTVDEDQSAAAGVDTHLNPFDIDGDSTAVDIATPLTLSSYGTVDPDEDLSRNVDTEDPELTDTIIGLRQQIKALDYALQLNEQALQGHARKFKEEKMGYYPTPMGVMRPETPYDDEVEEDEYYPLETGSQNRANMSRPSPHFTMATNPRTFLPVRTNVRFQKPLVQSPVSSRSQMGKFPTPLGAMRPETPQDDDEEEEYEEYVPPATDERWFQNLHGRHYR